MSVAMLQWGMVGYRKSEYRWFRDVEMGDRRASSWSGRRLRTVQGILTVNTTLTEGLVPCETVIWSALTTASCSSVRGCFHQRSVQRERASGRPRADGADMFRVGDRANEICVRTRRADQLGSSAREEGVP